MSEVETDNPHLADELLIVRHSGEIPEVALHGSLYYLARAPDGPGIVLDTRAIWALKAMVVERYREIIHRDLEPGNRDLTIYRGVARALVNWRRFAGFCRKEGLGLDSQRQEIGRALLRFIRLEAEEVRIGLRSSSINCSVAELLAFAAEVGLIRPSCQPVGKVSVRPLGNDSGSNLRTPRDGKSREHCFPITADGYGL